MGPSGNPETSFPMWNTSQEVTAKANRGEARRTQTVTFKDAAVAVAVAAAAATAAAAAAPLKEHGFENIPGSRE